MRRRSVTANAGGSVTLPGSGSSSGSGSGDGHVHGNKPLLDSLSVDNENYIYRRNKPEGASESSVEKIKAGYSDESGHSKTSDDSEKWDGARFDDYIDQPLRETDFVRFAQVIAGMFRTPNYVAGLETGSGAAIDEGGNAEMTSLTLRSFLKVPMLIYNKVRVTGGEMWNTEGGTIASLEQDPDSETSYILTLDIEDGDAIELDVDDICKGRYNKNGGFVTSYFRVTAVNQAAKTIRIVIGADSEVPGGQNHPPLAFMNIARYGNFTNRLRQRSQYFSSNDQRIILLDGVDQYIIEPRHYKVVIGSVPVSLVPDNLPVSEASIYLDTVLAKNFFQIDSEGKVVRTIRDRELWSAAVANSISPYRYTAELQDAVYHKSCRYYCIRDNTTDEPRYDSPDWLLVAGDTTLSLDIESSDGETFLYGQLSTTLTAKVRRGLEDITAEILLSDWSWTRETGDVAADTVWNTDHAGCGNSLKLTNEDLSAFSGKFICQAYVRDGAETLSAQIDF